MGRGHHSFVGLFCLIVPKKFVGGTLVVSETFWYGKKDMDEKGFPPEFYCLTVTKKLVGEPFCVSGKFLVLKLLMHRRRAGVERFWRNFFVSQYQKIS